MPRTTNRKKRAKELIYGFLNYLKIRAKQAALRHHRQRRFLRRIAPVDPYAPVELAVEALDSEMSTSSTSSTETRTYLDSTWISDMFGSESESESSSDLDAGLDAPSLFSTSSAGSGSRSDLSSISGESENEEEDLLLPLVVSDEDSDSDTEGEISGNGDWAHQADFNTDDSTNSMGSESSGSDDGNSADIEDWDDFEAPRMSTTAKLARGVRNEYEAMYASRYEVPRTHFPKPPADLPHVLKVYKTLRPDHFRKELRVTPHTFDQILEKINNDPIFTNASQNPQMPIEEQLAITLYRFGHFGNAASLDDVAKWSGYAKGTVLLATQRAMTAILRREFMDEAVSLPTEEQKEEAKEWVESKSCKAWRDGWCMVDGTLVPLYERPFWFGESYFDRKCNYSLNFQV
jgi:hypothetical protein